MKTVLINKPFEIAVTETEKPAEVAQGEALLKVLYGGICGADVASYTGNQNDYSEVKCMISEDIKTNYKYIYEHWKGRMFLYDLGNTFNDWYLKIFSQSNGTISYNDTPTEVDPGGYVVTLSNYQSIYFKIYYDKHSS